MKLVRSSASCSGRLYPQEMFLVLIFTRGWVDTRARVRSEGICHWKIQWQPGIDPGTVLLVAQCLNHYATPGPQVFNVVKNLQCTIKAEQFGGSEYELYICCASANYDFSVLYIQLSLFKYFTLHSNFKDYWRYDAEVKKPTSLYLIQIYALNIFSNYDPILLRKKCLYINYQLLCTDYYLFIKY